jgi:hypothetical protein
MHLFSWYIKPLHILKKILLIDIHYLPFSFKKKIYYIIDLSSAHIITMPKKSYYRFLATLHGPHESTQYSKKLLIILRNHTFVALINTNRYFFTKF